MKTYHVLLPLGLLALGLCACQSQKTPPLRAMNRRVDLAKFMGDWYVIAHIPASIEKNSFNGLESYKLSPDGTIATTYTFNEGALDGPLKTYKPKGFVKNHETNAEWRMQFIWPIKAAYLITHLSDDYQETIISVPDRKYVWIMARTKTLPAERYEALVERVKQSGYDVSKLRKVPQHP